MSDANMIFVSRNDIVKLLEQAFEEGWNGYLDLRDATAEKLLEEYLKKKKEQFLADGPESSFVMGVNNFLSTGEAQEHFATPPPPTIPDNASLNWETNIIPTGASVIVPNSSFVEYWTR